MRRWPRPSWAPRYRWPEACRESAAATIRRDGDRLFLKIAGSFPEGPLVPRSETRFQGPLGFPVEFQLDAQGKVTGAIIEQGPFRIPIERR